MAFDLLSSIGAGFSGGAIVKLLDYGYQEYRRRSEASKTAKNITDKHMDPILKSADELVGKIRSLAQADFQELIRAPMPGNAEGQSCWSPYLSLVYLFAQFWCRVQILRIESLFVNLAADARGKRLLAFFDALEATKNRLTERAWERGMGEVIMEQTSSGERVLTFAEFVDRFLSAEEFRRWFQPLMAVLSRLRHTRERQRLLAYGVILHALIDTLDSEHAVTRNRDGWSNKLTDRTTRDLRYRVFRTYLPFVEESNRYLRAETKGLPRKTKRP
jgi:hypothetical protein